MVKGMKETKLNGTAALERKKLQPCICVKKIMKNNFLNY